MKNKVIDGFKRDFNLIKSKGWIESHRAHDTGIGKTFEDLIGIVENNNYLADYHDILELKASRNLSQSLVTLFTKAPKPRGVNKIIRERFGQLDEGLKTIHTTFSALKFNNFVNKYGFKIEIDETKKRLYVLVKDLNTSKIEDINIYYDFDDIKEIIENKCKYIAYIKTQSKKEAGIEYFKFEEALLLSGLTFDRFIESLKKGYIVYDIRIGVYRSGSKKGMTHDHGSGFRFHKNRIDKIFDVEKM